VQELQAHREEDVMGAQQLHRHDDQLLDHENRIAALSITPLKIILNFEETALDGLFFFENPPKGSV